MEHEDFWLTLEGWQESRMYEQSLWRNQTALICESFVGEGKGLKFVYNSWKLSTDSKKFKISDRQKAILAKHKEDERIANKNRG